MPASAVAAECGATQAVDPLAGMDQTLRVVLEMVGGVDGAAFSLCRYMYVGVRARLEPVMLSYF